MRRHRATGGAFALAALAMAAALGWLPLPIAGAYLAMSAVSFVLYWVDKAAAGRGGQRTPEGTLHLVGLLGGWPGALVAQQVFRHKTVKRSFQVVFWITVALNLAGLWWLISSGMVDAVWRLIGGR
jgi:uncharacterized membrane protein YsdA (DUF1294 family)